MSNLGKYTFLPWMKKGLGNFTGIEDNYDGTSSSSSERANVNVGLTLAKKDGTDFSDNFDKDFDLYGPGDVIGFSPKNVVKAYPSAGNFDFIPNYLPYIEFYDEDLPWRLTPAAKGSTTNNTEDRLTPWFFLVVLKDDGSEFSVDVPEDPNLLPILTLDDTNLLPPSDELGVFAHVHVNKGLDDTSVASDLRNEMSANPDNVISRIVCNRRLDPNTQYQGFLIPTFETGRLAGLNPSNSLANIGAMKLAWTGTGLKNQKFPIYYTWKFGTGEKGDFEKLAKDLIPRVLPPEIGVRDFDAQKGLAFSANFEESNGGPGAIFITDFQTTKLGIGGALKTNNTEFKGFDAHVFPDLDNPDPNIPKDTDIEQASFEDFLKNYLNLDSVYMDLNADNKDFINEDITNADGDPVVTAPLYAKWHAAIEKIHNPNTTTNSTYQWIKDLNLIPRNRATAGLGTDVVIDKQEEFMDDAWGQVGEVLEANRLIHQAQASVEISCKMHEQFSNMPVHRQLITTGPMHKKVRN